MPVGLVYFFMKIIKIVATISHLGAGAPFQIPLGELTALLQTLAKF